MFFLYITNYVYRFQRDSDYVYYYNFLVLLEHVCLFTSSQTALYAEVGHWVPHNSDYASQVRPVPHNADQYLTIHSSASQFWSALHKWGQCLKIQITPDSLDLFYLTVEAYFSAQFRSVPHNTDQFLKFTSIPHNSDQCLTVQISPSKSDQYLAVLIMPHNANQLASHFRSVPNN